MPDHLEARSDPGRKLALVLARREHLAEEGRVAALHEVFERLARLCDRLAGELARQRHGRRPVVLVVGPEGHHDPARNLVRKVMLQLAEKGGLRTAAHAGVLAPHRRQVDDGARLDVEAFDVDVKLRAGVAEAAVGAALLVARVLGQHLAVAIRHRRCGLHDHAPPGRRDVEDPLALVGDEALVGRRTEHRVGDAEGAGQELHVRDHVPLAARQDARGRLEIGRRLGQRQHLLPRVAAGRGRHAKRPEGDARVERSHVALERLAEDLVADRVCPGGVGFQTLERASVDHQRRAAQHVVGEAD